MHIIYKNSDPNFQINLKIHQKYHKHTNQKQKKQPRSTNFVTKTKKRWGKLGSITAQD